jgi:hypothetical protein
MSSTVPRLKHANLSVRSSHGHTDRLRALYEKLTLQADSIGVLEINANSLHHYAEVDILLPNVHTILLRITPQVTFDYRAYMKTNISVNWEGLDVTLNRFKHWLSKVRCPNLELLDLRWTSRTGIQTIEQGEIEDYDRDGPIYDTEYEYYEENFSFDMFVQKHELNPTTPFDWSWIPETYPKFKQFYLPYTLYANTPNKETYPFEFLEDFDEQDPIMYECVLRPYMPPYSSD